VAAAVRLEGFALHAGTRTAVTLRRHDGPLAFEREGHRANVDALRVVRTDFGVGVADDRGFELDLVEHLFAAFAGLGIRAGILASVEGPELPILDGGARAFGDALASLEVPVAPPALVVARRGLLEIEESSYAFEPGPAIEVGVEVRFEHPAIGTQRATWDGDAGTFRASIAPARTFGFASDRDALAARGRAGLAAEGDAATRGAGAAAFREAVIVFDASSEAPRMLEAEIAKHKLLDLIGDLALHGGPPQGRIFARRPGHTATHAVVRRALDSGILARL
jgi:UDP-3-O-[3-hydroxymyristoyl] N-acetylglucosamine deacetylase